MRHADDLFPILQHVMCPMSISTDHYFYCQKRKINVLCFSYQASKTNMSNPESIIKKDSQCFFVYTHALPFLKTILQDERHICVARLQMVGILEKLFYRCSRI